MFLTLLTLALLTLLIAFAATSLLKRRHHPRDGEDGIDPGSIIIEGTVVHVHGDPPGSHHQRTTTPQTDMARAKDGTPCRGPIFQFADLNNAKLANSTLMAGADLRSADLTGADLRGADLSGADLTEASIAHADLTGADLTNANLEGTHTTGAIFADHT